MNLRKKMLILLKLTQIKMRILKVNIKKKERTTNKEKRISITHQVKLLDSLLNSNIMKISMEIKDSFIL